MKRNSFLGRMLTEEESRATTLLQSMKLGEATRLVAGALEDKLEENWVKAYGLKRSQSQSICACALFTRRHCYRSTDRCSIPGRDHESLWLFNGKPSVYVYQPYDLDIGKLHEYCQRYGLVPRVASHPAWHFYGNVLFVALATEANWKLIDDARFARNKDKPIKVS